MSALVPSKRPSTRVLARHAARHGLVLSKTERCLSRTWFGYKPFRDGLVPKALDEGPHQKWPDDGGVCKDLIEATTFGWRNKFSPADTL